MKSAWSRWHHPPAFLTWGAAILFVAVAAILTAQLRRVFPTVPNSLFFCAVILSTWLGGWRPGFLTSILSSAAILFWMPPQSTTIHTAAGEVPRFLVFLLACCFISWLCNRQKRAQVALRQARDELEKRVNERTKELTLANEGLRTEIAGRKRTETLLDGQRRVLEMIADNAPLSESLAALMRLVEAHVPGMLGSVLLMDKEGVHLRHGAAPSLPSEYMAAIDGVTIGPDVGSCGTAAYLKEAVIVEDIATDPRWKNYRTTALPHGLRACWSTPIFDPQQCVVGTFAMYYRHNALPEPEHLRLIEIATHIAAIAICRDHSQAALRESEAKLNEAQRIANIGYWERDLMADLFTWSEGTARIFGLQPQNCTLSGVQLQEMIHPADRQLRSKAMAEALDGGPRYDLEFRIIRPDGEIRFVHGRYEIGYDAAGQPVRMFGTVQDITELKQAEDSLRRLSRQNEMILDTAGEGIWGLNTDGKATFINAAGAHLLGYEPHELIGQNTHALLHHNKADNRPHLAEECPILMTLRDGLMHRCSDDVLWRKDGTSIPVQYVCNPIMEGGKVCGGVVVFSDITELKENEQKLRQTGAELARVARLTTMGELTASIAHEVNQPLAAVVTNANAISRWLAAVPPNLDEAREAVQRIARDGNRASEVIKRIRALIKKSEPVRGPVSLNELVHETVALTQSELGRKKVLLETDLAPELPAVPADRVQLQQVLLNLVVNALDSMDAVADRPRILRIETDRLGPQAVHVSVQDNGVGIAPQETEHLYEPFYTTKTDGLGMGLAISRSIVEAHGGHLWVTPNDRHGVDFQFTLPVQNGGGS
ncbi:MAG TPA: PAS domain S-box protein [Verrucomicrobiae bacterium]|nr:PAS domain S-box protein [Verrucomicrobiae bacterium]